MSVVLSLVSKRLQRASQIPNPVLAGFSRPSRAPWVPSPGDTAGSPHHPCGLHAPSGAGRAGERAVNPLDRMSDDRGYLGAGWGWRGQEQSSHTTLLGGRCFNSRHFLFPISNIPYLALTLHPNAQARSGLGPTGSKLTGTHATFRRRLSQRDASAVITPRREMRSKWVWTVRTGIISESQDGVWGGQGQRQSPQGRPDGAAVLQARPAG